MSDRTPRDQETREKTKRATDSWRPPSLLPVPNKEPGVAYRYIRVSTLGDADVKNVSARTREGWVPVKASDHPELEVRSDIGSKFPDGVEVGGLLLCKTSKEIADQRTNYYSNMSSNQLRSVDNAFLRENNPVMPLLTPERRTRTTFGSGE